MNACPRGEVLVARAVQSSRVCVAIVASCGCGAFGSRSGSPSIAAGGQTFAQLLLDVGSVDAQFATARVAVEWDLLKDDDDRVGLVVHERRQHVGDLACHGSLVLGGLALPQLNGHYGHDEPPSQVEIGRAQRASASKLILTVSRSMRQLSARVMTATPSRVRTVASTTGLDCGRLPSARNVVRVSTCPTERTASTQAISPHRHTNLGGKATRPHAEHLAPRTVMTRPPAQRPRRLPRAGRGPFRIP